MRQLFLHACQTPFISRNKMRITIFQGNNFIICQLSRDVVPLSKRITISAGLANPINTNYKLSHVAPIYTFTAKEGVVVFHNILICVGSMQ